MPTDAERLAVAEEIIKGLESEFRRIILPDGLCVQCLHCGPDWAVYTSVIGDKIVEKRDAIDAVIAARAKLAAEREAALPEEAKRWRELLRRWLQETSGAWMHTTAIALREETKDALAPFQEQGA